MNCRTAREATSRLLVDEHASGIDRDQLDKHLATCRECALPSSVIRETAKRPRPRSGAVWLLGALAMLVIGVIAGPMLYFHVVDGRAPALLALPAGTNATPGPLSGNWALAGGSQVGYRVHELLFGQNHTAVGTTSKVTGSMVISGATVTAVHVSVDMASIHSGVAGRDTVFRDHLLETGAHPHGDFALTRPLDTSGIPAGGSAVTEQATGILTLRGVSRAVSFPLQAERHGSQIVVEATIPILFSRWHIPDPSFAIAKVGDQGTLDLLLRFSHHR